MRAPFNTTCDIVSGPYSVLPGTVRVGGLPCRFILQNQISNVPPSHKPWQDVFAYVTMETDFPATFASVNLGGGRYDVKFAGMEALVIPSGGAITYYPVLVEEVLPASGLLYYRCHVRAAIP